MSAQAEDGPSKLNLTVCLAFHPKVGGPCEYAVQLDSEATIGHLKQQISKWDGEPLESGILLILGGRIPQDHEKVNDLLEGNTGVFHVTIKPSSWTMPFASELLPVKAASRSAESSSGAVGEEPYVPPWRSADRPPPRRSSMKKPTITAEAPTPPIAPDDAPPTLPSSPELARSPRSPVPGWSGSGANGAGAEGGYPRFLSLLGQLVPLQRALLLLNLQKAHLFYAEQIQRRGALLRSEEVQPAPAYENVDQQQAVDSEGELVEVRTLFLDCGLWNAVEEAEAEAEKEVREWGNRHPRNDDEFQIVQLGGQPFMLHLPPAYAGQQPAPDSDGYRSLKRAQSIHQVLTVLLQLVMTYQPAVSALAYGRLTLRSPPTPAAGLLAPPPAHLHGAGQLPPFPPGLVAAAGDRRPRAVLTMVINLEVVLSILVPLVLLTLKLGFLLWIFGRNASKKKRMILMGMAALWIAYEGYTMLRRRAAAVDRETERQRQERRRAERRGAQPPAEDAPAAAGGGLRERDVMNLEGMGPAMQARDDFRRRFGARRIPPDDNDRPPAVGPRAPAGPARRRRPPSSRLTPRYWLNWLAAFGLAAEAREMGLIPRSVAGRPVAPPVGGARQGGPAAQARWRAWRTALTAVVLFFGTLSPEVERKRKRALEKRDRLLAERAASRQHRARVAAEAAALGTEPVEQRIRQEGGPDSPRSGASTPGVFEAEESPFHQLAPPRDQVPRARSPLGRNPPASIDTQIAGPSTSSGHANGSTSQVATPTAASPRASSIPRRPGLDTNATYRPPEATHGTSPTHPPAGRGVISDAELFADGMGEPEQEGSAPQTETDEEQAVAEGRIETDDEDERRERREAGEQQEEEDVDQIVALF